VCERGSIFEYTTKYKQAYSEDLNNIYM